MNHQDWSPVIINNKNVTDTNKTKVACNGTNEDKEFKISIPKNLGRLISQARNTKSKSQKILSSELGIAIQVLSRWENGKEIPSNLDISKIEKVLSCKLPRAKKNMVQEN